MNGILLIDKPKGPTSAALVAKVKQRFRVKKVGHGGTLDPMATGLLPLALGEGTKLLPFLLHGDKTYLAEMTLGASTDTDDAEGKVLHTKSVENLLEHEITQVFETQVGKILQKPPKYSAIKRNGKPLYQMARAGEEFEVEARPVEIYALTIVKIALPTVIFEISCGKGTYIRSIARDVGEKLNVFGHLSALRRLRVGPFSIDQAASLETSPPALIPCEDAVSFLPTGHTDETLETHVRQGRQLFTSQLGLPVGFLGKIRILSPNKKLLAIAQGEKEDRLRLLRVFRFM